MDESLSGFNVKAGHVRAGNGGGGRDSDNNNNGNDTGTKCGRWNPTTEQVKVLTDLFRSGLRTPSTDQIQKISSQLSFYGEIESKNVFYWFQNHKARERQKRRKVSVDIDHQKDVIRRADEISSPKYFLEVNHMHAAADHDQPERVFETLQLFPLYSFNEQESQKLRVLHNGNEYFREQTATFSYTIGEELDHPPLDLRLSFL